MKKFYLLTLFLLTCITLRAAVADTPFMYFGLNNYEDWTYHRQGFELDNYFIQQGRVNLLTTESGEQATLESPSFLAQGMDSVKVYVDYRPHIPYTASKVALRIDILDHSGTIFSTLTQTVKANVIQQDIEVSLTVPTDAVCTMLFSAPKADVDNCAAVVGVKAWAVTAGSATPIRGDVNGDAVVDVTDVNVVINVMLGKALGIGGSADVTGDGTVDVSDVNTVINIMLGKV